MTTLKQVLLLKRKADTLRDRYDASHKESDFVDAACVLFQYMAAFDAYKKEE